MKDRLHQVMTHFGLSQQQFAQKLNLLPASISSVFNGRTNPTMTHVNAIHQAFPQINTNWLMFGEGSMFLEGEEVAKEMNLLDAMTTQPQDATLHLQDASANPAALRTSLEQGGEGTLFAAIDALGKDSTKLHSAAASLAPLDAQLLRELLDTMRHLKQLETARQARRVREIRVFYDDGTYESFGDLTNP